MLSSKQEQNEMSPRIHSCHEVLECCRLQEWNHATPSSKLPLLNAKGSFNIISPINFLESIHFLESNSIFVFLKI